jgi:hypothetical protein
MWRKNLMLSANEKEPVGTSVLRRLDRTHAL